MPCRQHISAAALSVLCAYIRWPPNKFDAPFTQFNRSRIASHGHTGPRQAYYSMALPH